MLNLLITKVVEMIKNAFAHTHRQTHTLTQTHIKEMLRLVININVGIFRWLAGLVLQCLATFFISRVNG